MTSNIDIILYALVAAILLVRLWAVLGRRNDEDRTRPNPFAAPSAGSDEGDVSFRLDHGRADEVPGLPLGQLSIAAPMSLMGALEQVKQFYASFDEKQFLQTARTTFASVVDGFAKGDLSNVEPLLGPSVLSGFRSAMASRIRAGETLQTRIVNLKDAETTAARVEDGCASITVRFVSEQENILRDADGNVVHGTPGKTEEITDLWTFARAANAPDWQVVETRS